MNNVSAVLDPLPVVVVVDDDRFFLNSAVRLLDHAGIRSIAIDNPHGLFDEIAGLDPDLFLLDVRMPGMDGYELCAQIKQDPRYSDVPVIFLTGYGEELEAFRVGGVDYVTKPYNSEELLARAMAHIRLHRALRQNRLYAGQMEHLAAERARRMIELEKAATLGALSAGIAHEIRNPLSYVTGNLGLLQTMIDGMLARIAAEAGGAARFAEDAGRIRDCIADVHDGALKISRIVSNMQGFARRGDSGPAPVDVNGVVRRVIDFSHVLRTKRVSVRLELHDGELLLMANEAALEQVISNLLLNAVQALDGVKNPTISVATGMDNGCGFVKVADNGPGIPSDLAERIWEPFFTTKSAGEGTGLGLSISRGLLREMNGTLEMRTSPTETEFTVTLRAYRADGPAV